MAAIKDRHQMLMRMWKNQNLNTRLVGMRNRNTSRQTVWLLLKQLSMVMPTPVNSGRVRQGHSFKPCLGILVTQ